MKQSVSVYQLTFMSICIVMSLVTKRVISPVFIILTDFIRIPGGGTTAAFSLMFLIIGSSFFSWHWTATLSGFVQGVLALTLGMSAHQGIFALLTYTLPGLIIDLVRRIYPARTFSYFICSCCLSNVAGAFLSNILVFHLHGLTFIVWMLIAAVFGVIAAVTGFLVYSKLLKSHACRRVTA